MYIHNTLPSLGTGMGVYGSRGHPGSGAGDRGRGRAGILWQSNIANEQKTDALRKVPISYRPHRSVLATCPSSLPTLHSSSEDQPLLWYRLRLQLAVAYLLVGATHGDEGPLLR